MRRLLPLFVFLLISSALNAQTSLVETVAKTMERYETVGLAVAVVKDGKISYQNTWGFKDLEAKAPLLPSDLFRIASISKSFTATAILQLEAAGKLSLQDDVGQLLGFPIRHPNYPNQAITVEMMLSHTSSLNDSQGYFDIAVLQPEQNPEWLKCFSAYGPGDAYQYCNLNYNILGAVIERVTNERFDRYIVGNILAPLGLYGGYEVGSLDSTRFAKLYSFNETYVESTAAYHPRTTEITNYQMGVTTPVFSPTGGMKISSLDLAKYMIMHMHYGKAAKKRVLPKKSAKRMQTPLLEGYGLGLTQNEQLLPGHLLIGHTGSAYGLYSSMFFDPKRKFGIVAITNGCKACAGPGGLLSEVSQLLHQELIIKK